MPNARNLEFVKELEIKFKKTRTVFLTDFRGLSVSDLANLRRQLREVGVDFRVAKNTLALIAADRAGLSGLNELLKGPTAIAFASGDEAATAKALSDYARVSRILTVKGGILGSQVLSAEDVADVSRLPAKAQLHADLVGAVQGPAASLIGVLNSALSTVVHVLDERVKQLEAAA
ncbi:MAG TPA: 50S ribosomal protein L10 [Chloroflexota bacterium]|nr:50S ribosomal protein L10 [Chloroflexota bacterium]